MKLKSVVDSSNIVERSHPEAEPWRLAINGHKEITYGKDVSASSGEDEDSEDEDGDDGEDGEGSEDDDDSEDGGDSEDDEDSEE